MRIPRLASAQFAARVTQFRKARFVPVARTRAMSDVEKTVSPLQDGNDAKLAAMGYKSELPRSLSMFSVLGLSFAIMAVPFGESTTCTTFLLLLFLIFF